MPRDIPAAAPASTLIMELAPPAIEEKRRARIFSRLSLRARLNLLVLASIVPLLVFGLGREYLSYQEARRAAGQRALDFANSMSLVVEQALRNRIATSRILGLSSALHTGDIQTFRAQAEAFLNTTRFSGANLVLLKEDGQELMNTFELPEAVLPNREELASVKEVFATGRPVVSDLFRGTVQQRPVVSIEVPIKDDAGRVLYSLALIPRIGVFAETVRQHNPPEGWVIAVYDRQGVIVARTHQPEQFIGQKAQAAFLPFMLANREGIVEANTLEGIPVLSAFSHTATYGWSVAVGVPIAELTAPAMRSTLRTLAVGGALLLVSLLLAHIAARQISGPIAILRRLAAAPDGDKPAVPAPTGLREADDVALALRTAQNIRKRSEDDQRRAIAALRASEVLARENEQRFRNLVDGSILGIVIHRDGIPLFVNQAYARIYGCETTEEILTGGSVDWTFAPHEIERVRAVREARRQGANEIVTLEHEARRKDGTPIWVYVQSRPVVWDGERVVQTATLDITERRRAEDQLRQAQKMEAVGQLTGGIAHDFNNILAVVVGNLDQQTELLADIPALSGEAKTLGTSALDAALRGAELVQRLLAFSRNQPLQPRQLNLGQIIREAEPLMQRALGERIKIETEIPGDLWPVLADRTQTENAVLNLAINARDAMPDGGRLTMICANATLDESASIAAEIAPGRYVTLAIVDTGSGIPPDVLAKVFEPFFTTKEVGKGSGLGLSMVFGFARQSGGTVKIYSEVGNGTEVRIYLPRDNSQAPANDDADNAQDVPPQGQERILVVEDKLEVREIAAKMLKSLGYAVVQAADGAAAIALLDGGMRPDLLFTDIVMPGKMSGIDVARKARRRFAHLPIIFTSGFSNPEKIHSEAVTLGASLISKPYRKIDLAKQIRAALDRAKK